MTCQPHSYFLTSVQGYLAALGWSKPTEGDAIAVKPFPGRNGELLANIYLSFGRAQSEHVLSARCLCQGQDILAGVALHLPRTEPVFMATVKGFVQNIEQTIQSAV